MSQTTASGEIGPTIGASVRRRRERSGRVCSRTVIPSRFGGGHRPGKPLPPPVDNSRDPRAGSGHCIKPTPAARWMWSMWFWVLLPLSSMARLTLAQGPTGSGFPPVAFQMRCS